MQQVDFLAGPKLAAREKFQILSRSLA
jgi:hypothetical protein